MEKWKKSFKLIKYAYDFKGSISRAIFLAVLAIVFLAVTSKIFEIKSFACSVILMFISFNVLLQAKEDLMFFSMVKASPFRKFFDICFADGVVLLSGIVTYAFYGVVMILFFGHTDIDGLCCGSMFVLNSLCIMIFTGFFAVINKYYIRVYIVTFILFYIIPDIYKEVASKLLDNAFREHKAFAFGLGICMILLANITAMRVRRLLYRKEASKNMLSMGLRKAETT